MFGVPLSSNCICMCFFVTCRYTGASQDPITLCIHHLHSSTCNLHIGKCTRIGWCKDAHTVFQSSITSSLAQMVTSLPNTIHHHYLTQLHHHYLIIWVGIAGEVGMGQCLLSRHPGIGVHGQKPLQNIYGQRVGPHEEFGEVLTRVVRH